MVSNTLFLHIEKLKIIIWLTLGTYFLTLSKTGAFYFDQSLKFKHFFHLEKNYFYQYFCLINSAQLINLSKRAAMKNTVI